MSLTYSKYKIFDFPDLATEFNFEKNLIPEPFKVKMHNKYWWICKKGHEYKSVCKERCGRGRGCPYCANKKVCKDNCLATLYPDVASEWHKEKNSDVTPYQVISKSAKKFWWKCKKGHEWKATCNSRCSSCSKSSCPICKESKGEKKVAEVLDKMKLPFKRQFRFNSCCNILPLPFDFVVFGKLKTFAIEFQGIHHYKEINFGGSESCFERTASNDKIKKNWCKNNNVELLEIPYNDFNNIETLLRNFLVSLI